MNENGIVERQLHAALFDCCAPDLAAASLEESQWSMVLNLLVEDVFAFASKDPAAHHDPFFVLQCSTSFKAVLHYRLAHAVLKGVLKDDQNSTLNRQERQTLAALIANRGKMLSGAEIHPTAQIGRRFILDHGFGTVIGETTEIGDDCYILGGVTLGAAGISGNPAGRRHPVLGNCVQVGMFARIFGRVHVGDNVFIGSHCVVKADVPAQSIVTLKTEQQIVRRLPLAASVAE